MKDTYYLTKDILEELRRLNLEIQDHTLRRYVRILEEFGREILKDDYNTRLYSEHDKMALIEMTRLVQRKKKTVKEAANIVINDYDTISKKVNELAANEVKTDQTDLSDFEKKFDILLDEIKALRKENKEILERLEGNQQTPIKRLNDVDQAHTLDVHSHTHTDEQTAYIERNNKVIEELKEARAQGYDYPTDNVHEAYTAEHESVDQDEQDRPGMLERFKNWWNKKDRL